MPHPLHTALVVLLPLAGFVLLALFGKRFSNKAGIVGVLVLTLTTIFAAMTAGGYFFNNGALSGVYQPIKDLSFTWLAFSPTVKIEIGTLLDPIAAMMIVVVSFVSLMVHLFSLGYMKGEDRLHAYYAYLSLFTFSMLGLVLSSNIFQIYMFWELVGVSSYLLIGFYFQKPSAVAAAKKAFIVTRFADLGFLIGILVLSYYAETLDFGTLIQRLTDTQSSYSIGITAGSFMGISALTWGLVLVFAGGAGKSAMFPLHIWLPDAMEGPTPVSALIHAATMVVAGVFLVARLFPLFAFNEVALKVVTMTGLISAMFAAVIACTQTDIKRVLAYSTMSQIGYMMFALGLGAKGEYGLGYTASLFHLFTHAFFKSLLFLGAGAIIHLVHSNDMKDMGGLRKFMPITHISFLVACLAIAGIPPFAGFFSKEEILSTAYHDSIFFYVLLLCTSGLTAFYMFRLYFSIFWRGQVHLHDHHGEGTVTMKLPLLLLMLCTVLAGFVPFGHFVSYNGQPFETQVDWLFSIAPVAMALSGIAVASWLYKSANDRPAALAAKLGGLYRAAYHKFYIDELYLFVTKKILFNLVGRPAAWIDRNIVDGAMNGLATVTGSISSAIKGMQSGKLQQYILYFFAGIALLTILLIYRFGSMPV
jgi:NADH-quinone oxidoreductase subunit L